VAVAKLSVIVRARNEWPIIAGTIHSIVEDLEWDKIPYEIIVVDNLSDDDTADIVEHRYQRWVRNKTLKVVRYTNKPSTWCAINAGYAAADPDSDLVAVADAHISVRRGTMKLLADGAAERGGIWHAPIQMWGDTDPIKRYGHDLRLGERFWGDPCPYLPPGEDGTQPWKIPMAGACLMVLRKEEIEKFGLYDPAFRAYGGGEPYLSLKWWLMGSTVWMEPRALVRHAFGIKASWEEARRPRRMRNKVYQEDGTIARRVEQGKKFLKYESGYAVSNDDFYFNFMLAAYRVGGRRWLDHMTEQFRRKFRDSERVDKIRDEVIVTVEPDDYVLGFPTTLNELLRSPPWKQCDRHEVTLPEFVGC
jgi:glycosyltransferase involved in cell wall biosynthesis